MLTLGYVIGTRKSVYTRIKINLPRMLLISEFLLCSKKTCIDTKKLKIVRYLQTSLYL